MNDLKAARALLGITQEQLAEQADITQGEISLIERGLQVPTRRVAKVIQKALGGRIWFPRVRATKRFGLILHRKKPASFGGNGGNSQATAGNSEAGGKNPPKNQTNTKTKVKKTTPSV